MSRSQFHGIISLGLIVGAVAVASISIFHLSPAWGIAYAAIALVSTLAILYAWCAKCPCRTHCGHVLPGKIAAIFKTRPSGPYTPLEFVIAGLALLLLLGLPQIWLWQTMGLFIAFWFMLAVAVTQIRLIVCRACDNTYCPANVSHNRL